MTDLIQLITVLFITACMLFVYYLHSKYEDKKRNDTIFEELNNKLIKRRNRLYEKIETLEQYMIKIQKIHLSNEMSKEIRNIFFDYFKISNCFDNNSSSLIYKDIITDYKSVENEYLNNEINRLYNIAQLLEKAETHVENYVNKFYTKFEDSTAIMRPNDDYDFLKAKFIVDIIKKSIYQL